MSSIVPVKSGQLTRSQQVTGSLQIQSIEDLNQLGTLLAKSGFFPDCRDAAQACVKILAGLEIGVPAFSAMGGVHIIQGKASIGAGLVAAKIKASRRYDYKPLEISPEACRLQFFENGEPIGLSEVFMKDIKDAKLDMEWDKNKNEWRQKHNWKSYPKNMLFARAISHGQKFYCPDVLMGADVAVLADEELHDRQQSAPRYPAPFKESKEWIDFQSALSESIRTGDRDGVNRVIGAAFTLIDDGVLPIQAKSAIEAEENRAMDAIGNLAAMPALSAPATPKKNGGSNSKSSQSIELAALLDRHDITDQNARKDIVAHFLGGRSAKDLSSAELKDILGAIENHLSATKSVAELEKPWDEPVSELEAVE